MLAFTGDAAWGDHCETVAFNSYPAAVMPDFRSLRYLTAPNMAVSDSQNHAPGIHNAGPFLMMNPFSSRCCQQALRQGDWAIIQRGGDSGPQPRFGLYNLATDLAQTRNLAPQQPARVKAMSARLEQLRQQGHSRHPI